MAGDESCSRESVACGEVGTELMHSCPGVFYQLCPSPLWRCFCAHTSRSKDLAEFYPALLL